MIALSRATGGKVPRSGISLATEGRLYADIFKGAGSGGDGSDKAYRKPHGNFIFTPQDIRSASKVVNETINGNEFEIERPDHINKTVYLLPEAKPINDFESEDQELISLLRLDEIKRHMELERIFAEEERKFEEEIAVFLLLIED